MFTKKNATRTIKKTTGSRRRLHSGQSGRGKIGYGSNHRGLKFEPLEPRTLLSASGGDAPPPITFSHVIFDPTTDAAVPVATAAAADAAGSLSAGGSTPWVSASPVGLAPVQICTAYGIGAAMLGSVVGNGAGQTIAIIDAYDDPNLVSSTSPNFATSDLHEFDLQFGLPDPPSFLKLNENGLASPLPAASGTSGWSMEECLDVEWAHSIAPDANIILFEVNSTSDADLITTAVNTARNYTGVSVVSMSFGRSEEGSTDLAENSVFTTPVGHGGVTFLASTGDDGSPGSFPAYSPNVVAAGGTTLTLSGNNYVSEVGWSDSGGGQSTCESEPSYQLGVQTSNYRQIPDVSFDANPATGVAVYDSYDDGSSTPWVQVGGTSVASPCWAGLVAIGDQFRASVGLGTMDGPTQTLPLLYGMKAADFHDITSGSNGGFSAHAGYDEVTGIGTPVANNLLPAFVPVSSKGTVVFSADSYQIGTSATITVGDLDLVSDPSCAVTLTSSAGDSETLNLAAQGGGVFTGSILISTGSVVPGDGVLETVSGGTITATYYDANDGTGNPATVTAQATTYAPLQITTTSPLPVAPLNEPYSVNLTATGGIGAYTWSTPSALGNYTESTPATNWVSGGTAQGWNADFGSWSLSLPFAFPFYGTKYSSVWVDSKGYLDFTNSVSSLSDSDAALKAAVRISPLWEDLTTLDSGDDIFITSSSSSVVVRWQAHTWSNNLPADFEAILYPNGNIEFNYGAAVATVSGDTSAPTIGVSDGDGVHYTLSGLDQASTIGPNISRLMSAPANLPPGVTLSPAGLISGTPTGTAATYTFPVTVVDADTPQNSATETVQLVVSALPPLTLTIPANATEGNPVAAGTVSIPAALTTNLVVDLASSDTSRIALPASVTILAGQTSVSAPITAIDTGLLDGPEAVAVTATASGYLNGAGTIEVHSGLTATLAVSLPASAPENGGTVTGTVTASAAPSQNVSVALSSNGTSHLTVPATVTLPAGQTSVNFTATLVDDHVIESAPMPVAVTAQMDTWTPGSCTINVLDEDATMTISLPTSGWKGQTLSGTIHIGGTLTAPLVVSLASSNTSQLTVPASVIIPVGSTSASFTATLLDNGQRTGPQTDQITATASGLPMATANVVIDDADVDHYTWTAVAGPETDGVPFSASITACDIMNNPILVDDGSVTLSATGQSGALTVSPTTVTLVNGTWTGSLTINAVDPTVTLKASDGNGRAGTSIVFAVQPGAVTKFQLSTISSPQYATVPFSTTITAEDVNGYTATGFNGSAAVTGWMNGGSSMVPAPGTPSATGNFNLLGTDLKLGINADGSLVNENLSLGANYLGNEFLLPGTPYAGFTLAANGTDYHNAAASNDSLNPVSMTTQNVSSGSTLHAQSTGTAGGIQITRDIWFQSTADAVSFQVTLQNTSTSAISNVAWMESYDPDQGYSLADNFSTYNAVLFGGTYVEAVYYYSPTYANGLTVGMGSNDPRAVAGAQGFDITNPYTVIDAPVNPGGALADVNSNLAFNVGTLAAGASTTITYYVVFATSEAGAAALYQAQLETPVPVTPATVTFINGVAMTNMSVQQTAIDMYLQASDGNGHTGASNAFDTLPPPALALSLPAGATEGDGTVTGWLDIPYALTSSLTVNLASGDPSRLTAPATETIPAGQTLVSFPITIIDTGLLDGPEAVTITATASGYGNGTGSMTVHSNESATLSVTLPSSVSETGSPVTGAVTASAAPAQDVTIQLACSGSTHLAVPATVTLPAGQTTVNFTATPLDDHLIEQLPMDVTVTASMDNWVSGTGTIAILDSDRTLAVTLPASGWKGQTLTGTVTMGGVSATTTVISLASGNMAELALPSSVTIPAGSASATFTATLIDNKIPTGPETVQVTANSSGFSPGVASTVIDDSDIDYYSFTGLPAAAPAGKSFTVTMQADDVLGNPIAVYNGTVSLGATGVGGTLVVSPSSITFSSGVWTGNVTVGTADPAAVLKLNNGQGATGTSSPIDVYAPLQVASTNPPVGGVLTVGASETLNVTFNQPVTPSSVTTSSLALSGITGATVSAVSVLAGNTTAQFTLSGMTTDGTLTASIAAGAVLDQNGFAGMAFTGSYITVIGTAPFPVPLTSVAPGGSLVYDGSVSATINPAGYSNTFTLPVDPNETVSVVVVPTNSTLQPNVQLLGPTGTVVGTATAAAAGQDALIQATATTGTTTGTYQIVVGGAGSTVGNYTVQVTLNAALDAAAYLVGAGNGTLATAQPLDGSFISLAPGGGATRAAVLGANAATSSPWSNYYSVNLAAGDVITAGLENLAGSGTAISLLSPAGVALASGATGPTNVNQAISGFSIPTTGKYYLLVTGEAAASYNVIVTRNAAFDTHPNSTLATAQSISGTSAVVGYVSSFVGGGTATLTAAYSGWWDSTGYHSTGNSNYEAGYDTADGAEVRDFFVFNLVSVSQTIASAQLSLYNPANGYDNAASSETYASFDVSTPISTLEASGSGQTAIFNDLGSGTSFATKTVTAATDNQDILIPMNPAGISYLNAARGSQVAVGGAVTTIAGTAQQSIFAFSGNTSLNTLILTYATASTGDWYSFKIPAAGALLSLSTSTPSDGPGEFSNSLSPHIQLYNPSGNLVASGTVGSDGRNETINYTPLVGGTYFVQVTAKSSTQGEYVLAVQQATPDTNGPSTANLSVTPADANVPPAISATINDAVAGNSVVAAEYFVDTVGANGSGSSLAGAFNAASVNVSGALTAAVFGGLSQGTHTVYVHGENAAGYWGPMVSVSFVKDTVAPTVTVSSLSTLSSTPTLSGGVNDPTATVEVTVAGQTYPAINNGDGTWTLPGSSIVTPLVAGIYDVQATATDPAGNVGGDAATRDLTVEPLAVAQAPLGSLVYSAPIIGNLSLPGLTDTFTVALDAGETVSLAVSPSSSLQPTVAVCDPSGNTLGSATATVSGGSAVVETVMATSSGNYSLNIGSVGTTTGTYAASFVLNAAVGDGGDSLATAEDITASFISLGGGAADRGAVMGTLGSGAPSENWYSFPLTAGETATIGLGSAAGSGDSLQLYGAAEDLLAQGVSAANLTQVIGNFVAPTTGTYYVCVSGTGSSYNLFLTRNADFDTEPNDPVTWPGGVGAQTLSTSQVLGAVTTSPNWYDFTLPAAADVSLSTVTPDNGAGQFSNTFDPYLELHDDSGDLLASAENNFGGTNALIDQPLAAGTYFVQVSAPPLTPASAGEYVLSIAWGLPAPTVAATPLITNNPQPALSGAVSDPTAKIQVTVDGATYTGVNNGDGTWSLPQGTIQPALPDGSYEVDVTALTSGHFLGVADAPNALLVDTTPPTVSISAPSASETSSGPIAYAVTYADANFSASDLTAADVALNATGTATGVVNVVGSGQSYTVTINDISGDGSLGISIAAGTAVDLAGNLDLGAGPSATAMVDNTGPTIAVPAAATPSSVTGTTAVLSVLGADLAYCEGSLVYSWAATTMPNAATTVANADTLPVFCVNNCNAAKNTTVTFDGPGSYGFTVTITDPAGMTTTSSVNVTVAPMPASISVAGDPPAATAFDQFGNPLASQPSFDPASDTITSPLSLDNNVTVGIAAGMQLTISGSITGAGGLIVDGPGSLAATGANDSTGGVTICGGTLIASASDAIPENTILTIGAGGTFIFDPSMEAAASAAPVDTSGGAIATSAVLLSANQGSPNLDLPAATAAGAIAPVKTAVGTAPAPQTASLGHLPAVGLHESSVERVVASVAGSVPRFVGDLSWLDQVANGSNDADQQQKKDAAIVDLDAVFAQYGQ